MLQCVQELQKYDARCAADLFSFLGVALNVASCLYCAEKAIVMHKKSLELFKAPEVRDQLGECKALCNLGVSLSTVACANGDGDYGSSMEMMQLSRELASEIGDTTMEAWACC